MNAHPLDGLYHQALGFPAGLLDTVCKSFDCSVSVDSHARRALVDDRYLSEAVADGREEHPGRFNAPDLLPKSLTVDKGQVIELEVVGGKVVKAVVRQPATKGFDIVLAFIPEALCARIKTLWLNRKSDQHKTLNAAAYRKP